MMPRGRRASARPRRRISPARQLLMQKKRECPIAALGMKEVDYLDTELLSRFIAENGMITASRLSGVSARMQRRLATAVKRARFLALLPYADQHISGKS